MGLHPLTTKLVLEGRETERCWQDDANGMIVHGPAASLGEFTTLHDDIAKNSVEFFKERQCAPEGISHFVTLSELGADGKVLDQHILGPLDFT